MVTEIIDYKTCFKCKNLLPLTSFTVDKRKYQLPEDKGHCKICDKCEFFSTLTNLSNVRYNYEESKFIVNHFNNRAEVVQWYEEQKFFDKIL